MSIRIKRHLQNRFPEIADLLDKTGTIAKLKKRDVLIPEAVVRVVTGQMLSSRAAQTIYERVKQKSAEQRVDTWLLDHNSLRSCGLSASKSTTISRFGQKVGNNPAALDHWYTVPADALLKEIKENKGMGDWTASIIALFYIGHEDVFPAGDGSLQKAIALIQHRSRRKKPPSFDPDNAAPYRSYLALYLWRLLDSGALEPS